MQAMVLHVCAVEARNIPRMEFLAGSDPYMTLQVSTGSAMQRTRVIEDTRSPIWNQEFHFSIQDSTNSFLIAVIKNRSAIGDDPPIAQVKIPLAGMTMFEVTDRWYDLESLGENRCAGAMVRIVLQVAPPGHPSFQPLCPPGYSQFPMQFQMAPPPFMGRGI